MLSKLDIIDLDDDFNDFSDGDQLEDEENESA